MCESAGRITIAGRYLIKGRSERKGAYPGYRASTARATKPVAVVTPPAPAAPATPPTA